MALSMCVVGCGGYARSVLDAVAGMTDEFSLYFASRDEARAKQYCEEYGGSGYFGSYEDAASDPRIESMYFFTPHDLHLENARLAAENGKHVLMEKPIARTIAEAEELICAPHEADVRLMIAENYRFLPGVDRAKELMAAGEIGDLTAINIRHAGFYRPGGWRRSQERTGGGVFIDGGIHPVDIMVNVGGFPERVSAQFPIKIHMDSEGEDGIVMMARLPGGVVGSLTYSAATPTNRRDTWVSITGSKANLEFDPFGDEIIVSTQEVSRTESLAPGQDSALRAMVREFRDAIADGREPIMSGSEGLRDLAVVLAAYESARTGETVAVQAP
jgi:predicted dehydrogenase